MQGNALRMSKSKDKNTIRIRREELRVKPRLGVQPTKRHGKPGYVRNPKHKGKIER
jgi:hypothetical protein